MEQAVVALLSVLAPIGVSLIGLWVARKKGLPRINAEIEQRMQQLVDTLRDEVRARTDELGNKIRELEACRSELGSVKREMTNTKRDLRNTEFELLSLYRSTGKVPPARLEGQTPDAG